MTQAFTGSTEIFISLWCQKDEHVKAWRWHLYTQGVTVDRFGHKRSSRTGEIIQ